MPLPEARTEVSGATLGDTIVVLGGLRKDASVTSRMDFLTKGGGWTGGPDLPSSRHHAGVAAWQGRVWLVGGYTRGDGDQWTPVADVHSWAPGEPRWREEVALPSARAALGLAAIGDHLVAVGGVGPAGLAPTFVLTNNAVLLRAGARWQPGPALKQGREHLAAVGSDQRIYAIGGRTGGLETNLASVESWAPGESAWRAEPPLARSRSGIGAAVVDEAMCVAGGEGPNGTEASVECFRAGAWIETWRLNIPRHGLAVVASEGSLHVIGGGPRPGLTVSAEYERLTPGIEAG